MSLLLTAAVGNPFLPVALYTALLPWQICALSGRSQPLSVSTTTTLWRALAAASWTRV